eukprot:6179695-Pleurochrysis_carterae.AAC.1
MPTILIHPLYLASCYSLLRPSLVPCYALLARTLIRSNGYVRTPPAYLHTFGIYVGIGLIAFNLRRFSFTHGRRDARARAAQRSASAGRPSAAARVCVTA